MIQIIIDKVISQRSLDTLQVLGDTSCLALYKFENDEEFRDIPLAQTDMFCTSNLI